MPHLRRRPAGSGHVGGDPSAPTVGGRTVEGGGTLSKFFDAQGNQLLVSEIANQQFVMDANGLFYIPQFDGLGNFTGVDLASSSQQTVLSDALSGGGGGTTPSFASTQAAADLQIQAAKDAAELLAAAREEELEADRELRLREARLQTARDLVNIRSAEAREARTQGVSVAGEDPFSFLAFARGLQRPTGTTPAAGFKQNLMGAARFEAPDLTGLDSEALQSAIDKLSEPITPTGAPNLGFAHGGTLDRGGVLGGTTQPGDGTVAIDVGEPINGMPNPETVILRPDGSVEVVQKIGAAQKGGVFDLGGFGPLFQRLRNTLSGTSRRSRFGFLPRGAEQETSAPFQAFAGPILNIRQGLGEAFQFQNVPGAKFEAQRISDIIGGLPNPIKIPPSFFNALLPAEKKALISAYRFAGVPKEDFQHLRTAPQLSFTPQLATAVG